MEPGTLIKHIAWGLAAGEVDAKAQGFQFQGQPSLQAQSIRHEKLTPECLEVNGGGNTQTPFKTGM